MVAVVFGTLLGSIVFLSCQTANAILLLVVRGS